MSHTNNNQYTHKYNIGNAHFICIYKVVVVVDMWGPSLIHVRGSLACCVVCSVLWAAACCV
jgi:hypothetical protein